MALLSGLGKPGCHATMVDHWPTNVKVGGSSPRPGEPATWSEESRQLSVIPG